MRMVSGPSGRPKFLRSNLDSSNSRYHRICSFFSFFILMYSVGFIGSCLVPSGIGIWEKAFGGGAWEVASGTVKLVPQRVPQSIASQRVPQLFTGRARGSAWVFLFRGILAELLKVHRPLGQSTLVILFIEYPREFFESPWAFCPGFPPRSWSLLQGSLAEFLKSHGLLFRGPSPKL